MILFFCLWVGRQVIEWAIKCKKNKLKMTVEARNKKFYCWFLEKLFFFETVKFQIKLFLFLCVNVRYMCFVINYQVFFIFLTGTGGRTRIFLMSYFLGYEIYFFIFNLREGVCVWQIKTMICVRGECYGHHWAIFHMHKIS